MLICCVVPSPLDSLYIVLTIQQRSSVKSKVVTSDSLFSGILNTNTHASSMGILSAAIAASFGDLAVRIYADSRSFSPYPVIRPSLEHRRPSAMEY